MNATCPACIKSEQFRTHDFNDVCKSCDARKFSRRPEFKRVRDTGMQDRDYREKLNSLGITHEEVKAAYNADAANREKAT